MNWLIFALMPPILWGVANIIDKFLMTNIFDRPHSFLIWMGVSSLVVAALVFAFINPTYVFPYSIIALVIGIFWGVYNFIYAKILSNEEVSRAIPLIFITPILVTILAGIFLGEILGIPKYVGILLLIASGLLLSYKREGKKISMIGSLKLILTIIILWAFLQIGEKFVVGQIGSWSLYFWATFGAFISSIPIMMIKNYRSKFINSIKKNGRKVLLTLIICETLVTIGSISFYVAIFFGPVSIVSAIGALQPFFVFIFALLLSIFIPRFLKEEISKYNLAIKLIAILLVLLGTWLLL